MNEQTLSELFAQARGVGAVDDPAHLDEVLRELIAGARAAWPGLEVDERAFVRHLAERIPEGEDPEAALRGLQSSELFLTWALERGDPLAMRLFEDRYLSAVAGHVSRMDGSESFIGEVRQRLRERLFVAAPSAPKKISGYSGRGPLGAWVRVVATRIALDLLRERSNDPQSAQDELEALSLDQDPELQLLKARYREPVEEAFKRALAELPPESRLLLALYFIDKMTVEQIGGLQKVNKSTITRRMAAVREQLFERTRALVEEKLALPPSEFASVIALLRSQLDLSIRALLKK